MHTRFNVWMLITTASLIVTAVMAAPAAAEDPQAAACAGLGNGAKNLDLTFTNTTVGEPTAVGGDGALLCGSDFGVLDPDEEGGTNLDDMKGFTEGEIEMPFAHSKATGFVSSLEARCANPVLNPGCSNEDGSGTLAVGQYMGSSTVSIFGIGGYLIKGELLNVTSNVYVHEAPGAGISNTHCTTTAVACFQAYDGFAGVGDIIIEEETGPGTVVKRSRMTIYQPVAKGGVFEEIYLTKIGPMDLCAYAGDVGAKECGTDPADWANKVGPVATWHTCSPEVWMIMQITFGGDPEKWTGGWGFDVSTVSTNIEGTNDWWGNNPAWSGISTKIKEDWDNYRAELSDYYKGGRHGQKPEMPPTWKKNGPGEAYEGITPKEVTDGYIDNNFKNPFCSEVTTTKADGTSDGLEEPPWSRDASDGAGRPGGSAGSDARDSSQSWDSKDPSQSRDSKDPSQSRDSKDPSQSSSDSRSGADSKSSNEKSKHRRSGHRRFSNG